MTCHLCLGRGYLFDGNDICDYCGGWGYWLIGDERDEADDIQQQELDERD